MDFLIPAAAFTLNLIILFFVVRKATRADAQIDLLKQILASQKPEVKSDIVKLTEERKLKGA
ncbi:MAG: hypothetical protein [Caudoviricetes sp.]|nr:MAG: hypothetical protein [Caudoviricetes sp.]